MIPHRTHTRTTQDRVASAQTSVIRVSRLSSKRKKRLNNVIHITIRPSNNNQPADNKSNKYHDKTHSSKSTRKLTVSSDSTAYSKSTHTGNTVRVHPLRRSASKSSGSIWTTDRSTKLSQPNNNYYISSGNNSTTKIRPPISSKLAHNENIIRDDRFQNKTEPVSSDQYGSTKDHHRNKKKKCPTCRCVIGSVIAAVLLVIVIAIVLLVILLKPTKTIKEELSFFSSKPTKLTSFPAPSLIPLLRWNTTGITIAGTSGITGHANNQLNYPLDVKVDYSDTLYIADHYNHRIQKYLMGASYATTIAGEANGSSGSAGNQLDTPSRVLIDSNGGIFIADVGNSRVQFWNNGASTGTTVAGIGGLGTLNNQLSSPYSIARDVNTGTLYVGDYNNERIMSYASGATSGIQVAGGFGAGYNNTQLNGVFGLYFDSLSNSLIVSNINGHNIVRWVLGDTSWTLMAGSINGLSGNTSTLLEGPTDVTFDPMGNMYVADNGNHRIQLFMAGQSNAITIAGISGVSGSNRTTLNAPYSVELDNQLNLYVSDTFNQRIQKFVRY